MPLQENWRQWSVNDFWPFINGNQSPIHLSLCIYDILTVFLRQNGHELFVPSLLMNLVDTVREAVAGMSLAYVPREAANSSLIDGSNDAPIILPKMRDLKSLTLI